MNRCFCSGFNFFICLKLVYKQPDKAKKVSAFQQFSNYVIMESCVIHFYKMIIDQKNIQSLTFLFISLQLLIKYCKMNFTKVYLCLFNFTFHFQEKVYDVDTLKELSNQEYCVIVLSFNCLSKQISYRILPNESEIGNEKCKRKLRSKH